MSGNCDLNGTAAHGWRLPTADLPTSNCHWDCRCYPCGNCSVHNVYRGNLPTLQPSLECLSGMRWPLFGPKCLSSYWSAHWTPIRVECPVRTSRCANDANCLYDNDAFDLDYMRWRTNGDAFADCTYSSIDHRRLVPNGHWTSLSRTVTIIQSLLS